MSEPQDIWHLPLPEIAQCPFGVDQPALWQWQMQNIKWKMENGYASEFLPAYWDTHTVPTLFYTTSYHRLLRLPHYSSTRSRRNSQITAFGDEREAQSTLAQEMQNRSPSANLGSAEKQTEWFRREEGLKRFEQNVANGAEKLRPKGPRTIDIN